MQIFTYDSRKKAKTPHSSKLRKSIPGDASNFIQQKGLIKDETAVKHAIFFIISWMYEKKIFFNGII